MNFLDAWREAEPYTMLGAERGRVLWDKVREALLDLSLSGPGERPGPFPGVAELGVYRGGTALLLRRAAPHRPLVLFDTFTGHPSGSRAMDVAESQPSGRFGDGSLVGVAMLLEPTLRYDGAAPITLHVGAFPASLGGAAPPPLVFVHVDCDLYDSVAAACRVFWPALEHGGTMLFDDFGFEDCKGARRAVEEFSLADPELRKIVLPGTGQAWVRKP